MPLEPGSLWEKSLEVTERALRLEALQPIPTESEFVEQDGIRFLVRVVSSLRREGKPDIRLPQKAKAGDSFNPFLPHDKDLFVSDISDTHLCVLNKYNIVDHHLLIITRAFESQESALTLQDFEAVWSCLQEFDGLAFYNAGEIAGASQPHKHIQYIPLPVVSGQQGTPIDSAIAQAEFDGPIGKSPGLHFAHAIVRLDGLAQMPVADAARKTLQLYEEMLQVLELHRRQGENPKPYNLLATRQWLMIVPRTKESFGSISVNSMGFAGAFLVRDREKLELVREVGPMTVLRDISGQAS